MQRWFPAITAAVAILLFLNTLGNGMTFDDRGALEMARKLAAGESSEWGRALTYGTHLLDQRLWGEWIPGHRITNILLYGLATALATLAAMRLSGSRNVALFTGLLFAVHPVHVEAVASIAFRKDVLAMLFAMGSLLFWMRPGRPQASQAPALLCLILGLISKEVAVIGLVPFFYLVDRMQRELPARRALRRFVPVLVVALVAVVLLNRTLHTPVAHDSIWARFTPQSIVKITEGKVDSYTAVLGTAACAFLDVLRLLVFPARLSADYVTRVQASPGTFCALAGAFVFLACAGAALWLLQRGHRRAFLAMAWVLLLYLPASNLVPLTHFFVADRYLLVPSFGFCLLLGLGFEAWANRTRRHALSRYVPQTLLLALVVLGAGRSLWRNRDWRNEETLWTAALRTGSDTYRTHYNLGNAFMAQEQLAAAMAQFEAALRLYPEAPWARRNLVQVLFDRGYYEDAERHLRVLVQQDPDDLKAMRSLAQVLLRQRKFDEALEAAGRALQREPGSIEALYVRSVSLDYLGRRSEAIASYGRTLEAIAAAAESPISASRVRARLEALEAGRSGPAEEKEPVDQ